MLRFAILLIFFAQPAFAQRELSIYGSDAIAFYHILAELSSEQLITNPESPQEITYRREWKTSLVTIRCESNLRAKHFCHFLFDSSSTAPRLTTWFFNRENATQLYRNMHFESFMTSAIHLVCEPNAHAEDEANSCKLTAFFNPD